MTRVVAKEGGMLCGQGKLSVEQEAGIHRGGRGLVVQQVRQVWRGVKSVRVQIRQQVRWRMDRRTDGDVGRRVGGAAGAARRLLRAAGRGRAKGTGDAPGDAVRTVGVAAVALVPLVRLQPAPHGLLRPLHVLEVEPA